MLLLVHNVHLAHIHSAIPLNASPVLLVILLQVTPVSVRFAQQVQSHWLVHQYARPVSAASIHIQAHHSASLALPDCFKYPYNQWARVGTTIQYTCKLSKFATPQEITLRNLRNV